MKIWLNNGLVDEDNASIHPRDRGLMLGDGLFETLAVRQGKIEFVDAHLARLRAGCDVLRLPLPVQNLMAVMQAVLSANAMQDAALRLTLTRGVAERGLLPPETPQLTLMITASPLPPDLLPAVCHIAQVTRRNEFSPLSRIKALPYLDNILALQEARDHGADEAIILNAGGHVACASRANIIISMNGQLITPSLSQGALPGIVRGVLLQSLKIKEATITVADLQASDATILVNSLSIRAVQSINGHAIGSADGVGLVATRLREVVASATTANAV